MTSGLGSRGALLDGRFRLDAPVDACGLGEGWSATDAADGDRALVKLLSRPQGFEALLRVPPLAAPQVVPVRGLGVAPGHAWIATDAPEGASLARWIDQCRATRGYGLLNNVRSLATALCSAVAVAHRQPSPPWNVHGGLNPQSVFVAFDPTGACDLQLYDLALAPFSGSPPAPWGRAWFPLAPELDGTGAATPATDVFCLAVLLLESLAPRPVREEALRALAEGRPAWVRWTQSLRADVDPSLWTVLGDALQSRPEARPRNADQLARALREARWAPIADDPQPRPPARPAPAVAPAIAPPQSPAASVAPRASLPSPAPRPNAPVPTADDTLFDSPVASAEMTLAVDERGWRPSPHASPAADETLLVRPSEPHGAPVGADAPSASPALGETFALQHAQLGSASWASPLDATISRRSVPAPRPSHAPGDEWSAAVAPAAPPATPRVMVESLVAPPIATPTPSPRWMVVALVVLFVVIVGAASVLLRAHGG